MSGRGRGRGRGRELTRPAWMKAEGVAPSLPKPSAPAASGGARPPPVSDWKTATSATGRVYWYSLSTGKTTWEDPTKAAPAKPPTEIADEWKEHRTPQGRLYFFNARTRETRWERPAAAAPVAAQPASAAGASAASAPLPPGWAENKAADGRVYYYHSVTRETTWTRPTASAPAPMSSITSADGGQPATGALPPGWAEFRAPDGRPYYYHKETSKTSWTNPAFADAGTATSSVPPGRELGGASKRSRTAEGAAPRKAPRNLRRPREEDGTPMRNRAAEKWLLERAKKRRAARAEKAATEGGPDAEGDVDMTNGRGEEDFAKMSSWERKKLFMNVLEEHGVTAKSTWLQAMDRCVDDVRYEVLGSYGERKSAFHVYVQKLKSTQQRTEVIDSLKANENFWKFLEVTLRDEPMYRRALEDCRPDVLKRVRESAEYRAVVSDSTRYGLTRAFFDQRQRALEREKAEKRKRLLTRVRLTLDAMTDPSIRPKASGATTNKAGGEERPSENEDIGEFSAPWLNGRSSIREVDRRLTSLSHFRDLKPKDIQIVYEDWIRDVDKLVDEKRNREKEARRTMQRANRAKFRSGVLEMMLDGRVGFRAGWKDVAHDIGNEPFACPESELGERPANLFKDAREMFDERVQGEKEKFKDLLKEANVTVTEEMTEEQLRASENINKFFSSLQSSVIEALIVDRKRKEHRRRENAFADFERMLRDLVRHDQIPLDATYDAVQEKIGAMEPTKHLISLVGVEEVKSTFDKFLERRRAREERRVKRRLDEPNTPTEKRPRVESNGMPSAASRARPRDDDTGWAAAVSAKPLSAAEKAAEKERKKRALLATLNAPKSGAATVRRPAQTTSPASRFAAPNPSEATAAISNGHGASFPSDPPPSATTGPDGEGVADTQQAPGKDPTSSKDEPNHEAMLAK